MARLIERHPGARCPFAAPFAPTNGVATAVTLTNATIAIAIATITITIT